MKRLIFKLIATYIRNTLPHKGRGVLARFAWNILLPDAFEISQGVKIRPRRDSRYDFHVFLGDYEKHGETKVFLSHLREGMTVMDIGANIGVYALHFARKVGPNGKVYAFEPVPENFERLKEHIALNNATNIVPVPLALFDRKGTVKISVAEGASSIFCWSTDQFVEVPTTTLDEFVAEQGVMRVDALKLDVEGAELQVIHGADKTIRQFKPVMMVELNEYTLRAAGTSPEELFQTITSYGYKAFVIRNKRLIPSDKVVRPTSYPNGDNYLFLP
ncbi:MAG: FkbM family methyltransferase [Armatimonadota bacterium]